MWPSRCRDTRYDSIPARTSPAHVHHQWSSWLASLWGQTQTRLPPLDQKHSVSLATINRTVFSSLPHRYSTTILLKSIFVEIQKYYWQPSRWFYPKVLQNIKALEGKQTFKTQHVWSLGVCQRWSPSFPSILHFLTLIHAEQSRTALSSAALCSTSWSDSLGFI